VNEDTLYDVCDAFGLRSGLTHGGSRGENMSISCPLAGKNHGDPDDYNQSCSVSVRPDEPSLVKCYSYNCGFSGSFYRMLKVATDYRGNPPELIAILEMLAPTEKFTLESSACRSQKQFEDWVARDRSPRLRTMDGDLMAEGRFARYAGSVPGYIKTRGLTVETCKAWGLGHDRERKCLVFPVRRHDGKLVGMTGRHYNWPNAPTKYHNYAGLNKSNYLYGEHMLKRGEPLIICEGQIDAVLTWQYLGIPTVAILGEGFGQNHARTIAAYNPPVVYLFLDNDMAGRMAAEKVEYQLRGRVDMKLMLPPLDMDPGDCSQEQAQFALSAAVPIKGDIEDCFDQFLTHDVSGER